ncbi:type VI-B CRISPR-associated RNA-guided ribonuclease Cas13b [Prevotella sp.]|uniref:type VI-B CRISPR-associated RNA-guided ribonuclease Cas13b n=1 Tax=Prevotella sp. TaxID=59823 RepID=UPI00307C4A9B
MNIPALVENQKKYFGTYSVMAMLNAQTVLDHIQKVADIEGEQNENNENLWFHPVMSHLYNAKNGYDKQPEKTMFIIERLQSYFPFLKIMAESQREYSNGKNKQNRVEVNSNDIFEVMKRAFGVLKMYRDQTSHYKTYDKKLIDGCDFLTETEQPLSGMINKYYKVALRNTKERYGYKTEDLTFIQNNRYKFTKDAYGKRKSQVNTGFFLSLQDYNGDTTKKLHLSGVGIALLICLFLDKQYINLFLSRLPIFSSYNAQSEERRIIIRSFGINSIKQPKDRIHSEKSNKSVAMDMLNEVKRCPDELFTTLSAEKQSRFRIISDDHNEVLMKRSSDRFVQLLLQYIDYGKLFKNIRFHVNMGKLRYLLKADKECIDGQTRVRVIEQPLNGFGRLDEVEALRKQENGTFGKSGIQIRDFENMKRDDDNPADYPYIVDTYTHYMLENNKVEMYISKDDDPAPLLPEIEEDRYAVKTIPSCRMSTLEFPAMAFHMFLLGSERTERRIKEVYDRYKKLFRAMHKEEITAENIASFGIAERDLPKKILDIINGNAQGKDVDAYIKTTIDDMIADTEHRIKRFKDDRKSIRSADNKMGKRGFKQISTGKLADFLAKDIVLFQPSVDDGENKITGLNYRIMQSAIAVYDSGDDYEAKKQFKQMFEKARLIGKGTTEPHPFLYKVFAKSVPANAVDFYERYLIERKYYLTGLFNEIKKGNKVDIPFIRRNQNKWKTPVMKILGRIYNEDLPVELPRQMFDDEIKSHLKSLSQMSGIDFDNANVTYLIAEYMKRVLGDDFQAFYQWNRNYRYMDMLKGECDSKGTLLCSFTSVEEREALWKEREDKSVSYRKLAAKKIKSNRLMRNASTDEVNSILDKRLSNSRNEYQKNEKIIRRYKVQDALLFLLAKKTLTEMADFDGNKFKLKEIMPDTEKGILSEIMPMTFTFEKGGERYTITSEGMKLKNYGDFFVLANDKRLCKLLKIVGSNTVSKEDIMEEFKKYDQSRPEVVGLVFDLEKWAFDTYPELLSRVDRKERVDFKAILDVLNKNNNIDSKQLHVLKTIRNAFDHNDYPDKDKIGNGIVEITTLPEIAIGIKNLFGEYAMMK